MQILFSRSETRSCTANFSRMVIGNAATDRGPSVTKEAVLRLHGRSRLGKTPILPTVMRLELAHGLPVHSSLGRNCDLSFSRHASIATESKTCRETLAIRSGAPLFSQTPFHNLLRDRLSVRGILVLSGNQGPPSINGMVIQKWSNSPNDGNISRTFKSHH